MSSKFPCGLKNKGVCVSWSFGVRFVHFKLEQVIKTTDLPAGHVQRVFTQGPSATRGPNRAPCPSIVTPSFSAGASSEAALASLHLRRRTIDYPLLSSHLPRAPPASAWSHQTPEPLRFPSWRQIWDVLPSASMAAS